MPHAPQSPRRDYKRARSSSNDKQPPRDSRRKERISRTTLDDIEAILDATSRRLQASIECDLDKEFADYYWNVPRDEEYYLLLEDCQARYHALKAGPCPCTFREVLMTSGPLRPQYPTSAEHTDHTGEPESFHPPIRSSPRANMPLAKSTPAHALPASSKASASLPSKEETQKGQLLTSRTTTPAVKITHASSPMKMARIGPSDEDTGGRTDRVHTMSTASSIDPSSACKTQMNDDTSSIHNKQEPLPRSRNKTSEPFMGRSLPTREPQLSALSKKMRIASHTSPYAGIKPKERQRCLTAVEFMKGLDESFDIDAKSLRRTESLDTDVCMLRRRETLETSVRELRCIPVTQWSSPGEVLSSTREQSLEKKAVSEDDGQKVPKRMPVAGAALTLPSPPAFFIRAKSPRQSGNELETPSLVAHRQYGPTSIISPRLTASVSTRLITEPGAHSNAPKEAVLRPGVDPPFPDKIRHVQPPDEAPSTTLRLKNESAVSNEETSARKCSSTVKAAPTLPKYLPAVTIRAAPSHTTRNELKPHLPMVSGRHKPINKVVSPISTASDKARLSTKLGVRSATNRDVNRPGVSLPFRSELRSPTSHIPPVRTEVLSPTRRPRDKVDVNKKKTSMLICSPVRPAARWKPNVVSISQRTSIKTYRTTEPCSTNTQQLALQRVQSSFSPVFPDKTGEERQVYVINEIDKSLLTPCSPESQTAPILPIPTPLRRLHDKLASTTTAEQQAHDAVNEDEETNAGMHLPEDVETPKLPGHSQMTRVPPVPPSLQLWDKALLPIGTMLRQRGHSAINMRRVTDKMRSSVLSTGRAQSERAHAIASCAISFRQPNPLSKLEGANRPPVGVVPIRHKPSVISARKVTDVKACRRMEAHSRVSPNGPFPRKVPPARQQEQLRRAVEDTTERGPANERAQAQPASLMGEMGEERWDCSIISKIIRAPLTPCSPEALTGLTLPIPRSPSVPPVPPSLHSLLDESAFKSPAKQRVYDIVMDKSKEEKGVIRHLPEGPAALTPSILLFPTPPPPPRRLFDEFFRTPITKRCNDIVVSKKGKAIPEYRTAPASPVHLPAPPVQISAPRQSTDKCPPETTPRWTGLHIVNTKHLTSAVTCSPTNGTARKQPGYLKAASRENEGRYLERAAVYILERMSRRKPACDAFTPRARSGPHNKLAGKEARQRVQEAVSKNTTSATTRSPNTLVAFAALMPEPNPDLPSASISPTRPNNDLISNGDQSTMLPTIKKDTHEAEINACLYAVQPANERNVNATRSPEVRHEGTGIPIETAKAHERSNEHFPKDMELAPRVLDNSRLPETAGQHQWPSQDGVIGVETSASPRLPEPTFFTPLPTYQPLRLGLLPEVRLRWRPPDHERAKRVPYGAVNEKTPSSVIKHSHSRWTVLTPSALPPAALEDWAESLRNRNVELDWRARRKPPNAKAIFRQTNTGFISAIVNMGIIKYSPSNGEVHRLPDSRPLLVDTRAISPSCLNAELTSRVRKPPDPTTRAAVRCH
jgi:hypothetical protein